MAKAPVRWPALWALFLLAASLALPWFTLRHSIEGVEGSLAQSFTPFGGGDVVDPVWPRVTGGLAILAGVLVLVRLAAHSWTYEPRQWRRDHLVAAGLAALACASTLKWPVEEPWFWDTVRFQFEPGTASSHLVFVSKGRPGSGWWAGLAAMALLVVGWLRNRPAPEAGITR